MKLHCPAAWPSGLPARCKGKAGLTGAASRRYRVAAGKARTIRFDLRDGFLRRLDRRHRIEVTVRTRDLDAADGTVAKRAFTLRRR